MAVNLNNALVVAGDVPDEMLLGFVTLSTNPDREVSGSKLLRSWAQHGLDVNALPDARQPVHIFQSACSSVKRKRATSANGDRIQVTADEVADNGTCDYQIGVKVWDVANKVIEYRRDMLVTFDKDTSAITTDADPSDARLAEVEGQIREHFDANATTVPGQKVRNAVRETVLSLGGQNLRRKAGGVYFTPTTYQRVRNDKRETAPTRPVLEGLRAVLEDLYGGDADFHIMAMAGTASEREMVAKHFALNVNARAEELALKAINRVREGTSGKSTRGVRSDFMLNLENDRRELLAMVDDFTKLVSVEQTAIAQNLHELEESLRKLRDYADKKDVTP